ncbi:MAG: HD domain-containing protein [Bacilli bacterium]|nr:HD domain-containing protein [Bacilli bacterium]
MKRVNRKEVIKLLNDLKIDKNKYIVLSSGALVLRGILDDAGDLDLAVDEETFNELNKKYDLIKRGSNWYRLNDRYEFVIDDSVKYENIDSFNVQDIHEYLDYLNSSDRLKDKERIPLVKDYIKTSDLVNKTLLYVEEFFSNDFSGHDFYHTLRVYNLARNISYNIECDRELVYLASLLHDVDDYKLVGKQEERFINAKTFLKKNNYPQDRIDMICHIISQVSFKGSDSVTPDTIEGKIVQDADRLDALGAIGIARTFAFGGNHNSPMHIPGTKFNFNMNSDEYYNTTRTSINHFYEKLLLLKDMMNTDEAKRIALHRHKYMEKYLEEFYKEWDGLL